MGSLERQQQQLGQSGDLTRSEPLPAGTIIARYTLRSLIGSGAMGDVYRAHDRTLDREVALKVLPSELVSDRDRVRRFAQEARAASALSHPHIVTIHEVGHARPTMNVRLIDARRSTRRSEVHYIAMELVEGQTLRDALNHPDGEPLTLRRTLELLAQVADGLGKAHGAGIIHRDLKPDNIIVSRDGYAKIVDFGLAKLIDSSWNPIGADSPTLRALTAHGELLGTPGYMAPEQIGGKTIDGRADIFSFGCILYEAVTHARPFEAESFVDTLYKILHEEPAPLSTILPDAPADLERIVSRCLSKDRENRYQSIRDVAADLRSITSGTPVAASPTATGRLRKAPLVVALIALLPVLGWLFLNRSKPAPEATRTVQRITSDGRAVHVGISPDGRYVAYVSSTPEGQMLQLEQVASGAVLTVVPANRGHHYAGVAFAPDGQSLYFTRYDDGPIANLHRLSILGGTPQHVVRDIDSRVAISPDGAHLAFVRDDFNAATSALLVANTDGSGIRTLASFRIADRLWSPAWSPDGKKIIATQQTRLVEVSFPHGKQRPIETSVAFTGFRGISWPGEDRLVVSAVTEGAENHFRLWSIDPENGEATPLTNELSEIVAPAIAADGAIAALQAIRQANLFEVSADGKTSPLTTGVGSSNGVNGVAWLNGRVVYASSADGKWDLWSRGESESVRLTDDTAKEAAPAPAPDGSAVFYLSTAAGQSSIWRVAPDGSDRRPVTSGPRDGDFAVSPDSRSIAFASLDPKTREWGLWITPAAGGSKRLLTKRANHLNQIQYAPDGQHLFFTGYDDSALRVYRIPVSGGRAEAMIDGRSYCASISPDGTTVAASTGWTSKAQSGLALIPAKGGAAKRLQLDGAMFRWKPDGSALAFIRTEQGRTDLWIMPMDGRAPQKLTAFGEGMIADYAWSADGTRLVTAHVADAVDVVVIR